MKGKKEESWKNIYERKERREMENTKYYARAFLCVCDGSSSAITLSPRKSDLFSSSFFLALKKRMTSRLVPNIFFEIN